MVDEQGKEKRVRERESEREMWLQVPLAPALRAVRQRIPYVEASFMAP